MKIHLGRKYADQVLAFIPGLTARESQPTLPSDEIAMLKTQFLMVYPGLFFMRFVEQVYTQFYYRTSILCNIDIINISMMVDSSTDSYESC